MLCVAVTTLTALAVGASGFPVQHVNLNDGGIWVTDSSVGEFGRFDRPIAQLDAVVNATTTGENLDVAQNGAFVVAYDKGSGRLYAMNVYKPAFGGEGEPVAAGTRFAVGGSTLAVLSPPGVLRTSALRAAGGTLTITRPRMAHLPARAGIAVADDGTTYIAGDGQLRDFLAGSTGPPLVSAIPALPHGDPLEVTTVGAVPVVADPADGTLYLPGTGKTVSLPAGGQGMVLQQSSGPSGVVAVATKSALYSVGLADGDVTILSRDHSGQVAAPVQVDGCIHAAWNAGSLGSYVRSCDEPDYSTTTQPFTVGPDASLVFRVNRDEVVLNDTANGGVFLLDRKIVTIKPDWQPLRPNKIHQHHKVTANVRQTPLVAKPDVQGVRPGHTAVVHVLDNDSGPKGSLLAIIRLGTPDQSGVHVTLAPDAQEVLATVAPGLKTDAHFSYTIDDGHGHTAQTQVTLVPRSTSENKLPELRLHYHAPELAVSSGASLAFSVIGDWRDFDGDPVYLDPARLSATAGSASVAGNGQLSYTAPQTTSSLTATIRYAVGDGRSDTTASIEVRVLGSASTTLVQPVAEPDVVQAIVGQAVTIHPLANDIAGADPTNPQAQLVIAAPLAPATGAGIRTDLQTGAVTFVARHPGTFLLGYAAAFGAAKLSHSVIRVQVSSASGRPQPPVAVPDLAIIHGQQPVVADVLANDYDPQGWILGVTSATSPDPGIEVTVIDEHWLRISADDPVPGQTATVRYTVSDGHASATGTVNLSFAAANTTTDQVTASDDSIVIRAGDSAAVPVLVNDTSSAGLPLSLSGLAPAASPAVPGLLATDQGSDIRVVAPQSVRSEQETTVTYVATDATSATSAGHLHVTIMPAPSRSNRNQPPSPQDIYARETAGDILVIHVPTDGIDPDGDSTAVTSVTVPPALGRIVSIGPGTISYQSYPASSGTDSFTYQVTDPYGASGTAQVHVGVFPPGPPQPPVAVDDVISAPPGASLHIDVLANDVIAPGDHATVVPLARTDRAVPAGVHRIGSYLYLKAPAQPSDPPADITYGVSDGSSVPSLAHVIVHALPGAKLPPIAHDDVARLPKSAVRTVTVNVLANDDDPLGSRSDLKITWVPPHVKVRGASLVIRLTAQPREVPYEVTAPDGLRATAVVDVPGSATSAIRVRPHVIITVPPHGSARVRLGSVIEDAAGRPLKIGLTSFLTASPAGAIVADTHQEGSFTVRALGRYTGPGAVTVQVYDGKGLQDSHGHTATVTIPVQVGPDVPLMRCPHGHLLITAGGLPQSYDIGQLCHVWTDTTIVSAPPRYTVSWVRPPAGVSATAVGGTSLRLSASLGAHVGATGLVKITPSGSNASGEIGVTVVAPPPPSGRPVALTGIQAGHLVRVDLSQYVTSPLVHPRIQVVQVTHPASASVSASGPVVTITPAGGTTHGLITLVAQVTDAPGKPGRTISVAISIDVVGKPGAPTQVSATGGNGSATVSFGAAASNGAPIDSYTVYVNGAPRRCAASPCTVAGLTNGTRYTLYVRAHNSAGYGVPSRKVWVTPDHVPDAVTGVSAVPGDGKIVLSWNRAAVNGSPVTSYEVTASGLGVRKLGASATSATFTGLANGTTYKFQVRAFNVKGFGPWSSSVAAVPYGKPPTMAAPVATGAAVPDPVTTRAITVTWSPASPNGRPITGYTVNEYRSSSGGSKGALVSTARTGGATSASFTVAADGSWYVYTVSATNAAGTTQPSPASAPVQGVAPPGAPGNLTVTDHDASGGFNGAIHVSFTVPPANAGSISEVEYSLNGTPAGSWASPGPSGSTVTETISGLTNGASYTVSLQACNDAKLCGPSAGPSAAVSPYGPPFPPAVSASPSGTTITFTWGPGGNWLPGTDNGRPVTYHVCFDNGGCVTPSANGSQTNTYGDGNNHEIEAYVTDSTGQQSMTATESANSPKPVQPASVSVGEGGATSQSGCTSNCHFISVSVANFPAGVQLRYTCHEDSTVVGPLSNTTGGSDVTNGSGGASFQADCWWGYWNNHGHSFTVTVTGGGVTASGTHND